MLKLLLLGLLLTGCHGSFSHLPSNRPTDQNQFSRSNVQRISENSLGSGLFIVGAMSLFILKRKF
ncbi:hypothetical protein C7H19_09495 [Aphanothece hegewaldii CCALA 016]|uniref:Uncharacterized protein n=1 Tax=Aphanothece hegewaldii CCALA 016 TaxID=2107694 RepID=A0A2T1LZE8_9CHRO|nr:hypothetical protein C7H19_09495 [Aphanothece hegewaldii CCALA 016]